MNYFVATIRDIDIEGARGTRTVGYFDNMSDALACVRENWGDIYEDGYYKYAIIEDVAPGLYQACHSKPLFFMWEGDNETGGYVEIKRPVELKHFSSFTLG